jgi:hypothetical protein
MIEMAEIFSMQKKTLLFRSNYMNRKQKHGESVRDFSADILQRFSEGNPPLETQIDVYCRCLLPQISAVIRDKEHDDVRTLVAFAERADHRLRLLSEANLSINQVSFNECRQQSRSRSRDRRS